MDKLKKEINNSINKLQNWIEKHDFKAFDPFDGLNSKIRFLTFEIPLLRQVLVQLVKRLPFNIRPLIGISPQRSSKGFAYFIRGDLLLYKLTKEGKYLERVINFLNWLEKISCKGYSGYCWGNHFDYQTRGYFLKKNSPTLVWTSLTGRAFVEAYELTKNEKHLEIVDSVCHFIVTDLPRIEDEKGYCISYVRDTINLVHNSNFLGAAMLAQGYKLTGNNKYKEVANQAIQYSVNHQRANGSWFYGEENKYHWIDNWHTAYNLDAMKIYEECTNDTSFLNNLKKGFKFYKKHFFLEDGTPKYYHNNVYPLDIQCASQSIDTLIYFKDYDKENISLAIKVAKWTIKNMQDKSGYFYQCKNRIFTNKTPTLHWAQATMYYALIKLLFNLEKMNEN